MDSGNPLVVASVLTWNEYDDTRRCLESLEEIEYDHLEIVLVDNHSTDGSIERLIQEFPDIEVIRNDQNCGFSAAHNRTIEYALQREAEYVWVLNNDVILPPDCLEELVAKAETDASIGMITPRVVDAGKTWFSYGRVNPRSGYINTGPIARLIRRLEHGPPDRFIETDYAPLCCLLISTDIFRDVGLLSDAYFIYTEDVDFCIRARQSGYRVVTDTELTVDHATSSSSGGDQNPVTNYYVARNRWLLGHRLDSIRWHRFLLTYVFWLWKRCALALLNRRPDGLKALFEGTWDGLRLQTGKGRYP